MSCDEVGKHLWLGVEVGVGVCYSVGGGGGGGRGDSCTLHVALTLLTVLKLTRPTGCEAGSLGLINSTGWGLCPSGRPLGEGLAAAPS